MNKSMLMVILIISCAWVLSAQQSTDSPRPGEPTMTADGIVVDTEEIVIEVRSFAPVSGIYKVKQDTFLPTGKYRFLLDEQTVKDKSELLLNKWLKESK
nr:hypothetical protein [Candidatus Cloacimonadota bacterium]